MVCPIRKLLTPLPVCVNCTIGQLNGKIYELHVLFRLIYPLGDLHNVAFISEEKARYPAYMEQAVQTWFKTLGEKTPNLTLFSLLQKLDFSIPYHSCFSR